MALWRKHRFISLQEQDGKDRILAGSQFNVKRVGSTCVNDKETTQSTEIMIEFYKELLDLFHCEHGYKLRLVVDVSGAVLYSKEGEMLQKFELSNIRDVIYSTKKAAYSSYFILVGREESELSVKAHVLLCEDEHQAKLLYDTFIEIFKLGSEMRKYRRQLSDVSTLKNKNKGDVKTNSEKTNDIKDSRISVNGRVNTQLTVHSKLPRCQTWSNPSVTHPTPRIEKNEYEKYDSFTEFARSRSYGCSTSSKSDIDFNRNKIQSEDSDVFM